MRVREGRVQKKNNWRPDRRDLFAHPQDEIQLERRDPGYGHRHLVTINQLRAYLALLPDWDEIAVGLQAIILDTDDELDPCMGWYASGVVAVCAWEQDVWWEIIEESFLEEHRDILQLLEVEERLLSDAEVEEKLGPWSRSGGSRFFEVRWSEAQARAFQLLHILPHELGHHRDRISTRSKQRSSRGERYAETYSRLVLEQVWPHYAETFAL
jgi:hypothetical protein